MNAAFPSDNTSKVFVSLTLTNCVDQLMAERGFMQSEEVRSLTLDNVIADKRVTRLCLPIDIIEALGLQQVEEVNVQTSTGLQKTSVYRSVELTVEDRAGRYDCVALSEGQTPLLGLVPLEDMCLESDPHNQCLRLLPMRIRI